jgi:hexosaminidase
MPLGREDVDSHYYLAKIAKRLNNQVGCGKQLLFQEEIHTRLEVSVDSSLAQEAYELRISESGVQLSFATYSGYVYGLETLAQLVGEGLKEGSLRVGIVRDEPQVSYRGIMVDSARHFLGIAALTRLVESMPLSKLNILHWHLVDDESFPIELGSHPELAQAANYGKGRTYTRDQVKELLRVAALNAVQVVPEIDTPAHVRAWGLAPEWKNKNITIKCAGGTGYNGQFDLSKPETFALAADVVREVDELFRSSPYIHLGGDEVSSACWNLRPEIQNFMKLHNLKTYGELQMYWRFQLKQVLPAGRRAVFWRNDGANVSTSDDDVLHFWGAQADVAKSKL